MAAACVELLVTSEESVEAVLQEAKTELSATFRGKSADTLGVGTTGDVGLTSLDGPKVTPRLGGRY